MSLTKTTINTVKKLGLDIQVVDGVEVEKDYDLLWIYINEDDSEPSIFYIVNEDGSFTFSETFLKNSIKEELPATIKDEKHLRQVLKFIAAETK